MFIILGKHNRLNSFEWEQGSFIIKPPFFNLAGY